MSEYRYLVVTADQFVAGYVERIGQPGEPFSQYSRPFELVRRLPDGTVLVLDPGSPR